ncbi:MAG: hypothetical protein EBZ48_06290, partial [Proteobacteria bacterium]|nr:hypothetical protein [Pseudomonadota bacterium]
MSAQRRLSESSSTLTKTYERLSSGQRINRASDDAAGLAISQDLNARARVYGQALRNINDGVSVFNIADAAVNALVDINTRLQELAEQSANGVYSPRQRQSIDNEAQALAKEYFRISRSAQFNGTRLFDGSMSDGLRLQLGYGLSGSIHSRMGGNLGTGALSVSLTFAAESGTSQANALGDVNGDGILDMVSAGRDGSGVGYATVRLGQGDGTFGGATSYATESFESLAISLSDLNGDGALDLVTAGNGGGSGRVTVRLGTGIGTFGAATSYLAESTSTASMVLGDLNGDGVLDLVTAGTGGGSGRVTVRLGVGNGTFGAATSYQSESTGSATVTLGDINRDGILDVVSGGGSQISVRLGNGNGTFGSRTQSTLQTSRIYSVALGDIDNDGALD